MQTVDLIDSLVADLRPVKSGESWRRILIAVGGGAGLAFVAILMSPAVRNELMSTVLTNVFWMKCAFAMSVGAIALKLCVRLARPEAPPGALPLALLTPHLLLGVGAVIETLNAPAGTRLDLWLGHTFIYCPWIITALAVPALVGVLWVLRGFAPTKLRLTGLSAGCLAGAAAAVAYATRCHESSAAFVLCWYTIGILLPGLVGAWIGPRILRWS